MAMMATIGVNLRGTPHEWYFRAKQMIVSGEMDEKEVNSALSALIAGAEKRSRKVSGGEALSPSWSDVCHCMIRGWLSCREVTKVMKCLVEPKMPVTKRFGPERIVPIRRNKYGGKDEQDVLFGDEESCKNSR